MYKVLQGKAVIYSEFNYSKAGRIGFFLKQPGWGIEIFRDGDLLEQHVSRFTVGGAYRSWAIINDYILLDFRTKGPKKKRSPVCAVAEPNAHVLFRHFEAASRGFW